MDNMDDLIKKSKEIGYDSDPNDNHEKIKFEGTIQDFHIFVGPKIRNDVAAFTKSKKTALGYICQECNEKHELHAAHKHGSTRRQIIEKILENYKISENRVKIDDLRKVNAEIINLHKPIDRVIRFLCKKCHEFYDSQENIPEKKISEKIILSKIPKTNILQTKDLKETLCEDETNSWKYKLGWTTMKNRKNIELLIQKIESNFDCKPSKTKSWYYHRRSDTGKQFSSIICNKEDSVICFRIDPNSFNENDSRIILGKKWFYPQGKEGRVHIVPSNFDLIINCLNHAYSISF